VPIIKLSFEGSIPSLSIVLEQIVILLVDPCLDHVFTPLLASRLEILALAWALSSVFAHLIFAPA
jgi:hypothetical protein